MKIIFAGTPEFSVTPLKALIKEHEVVAVFSQPDRKAGRGKKITPPPVKEIALQQQIPVYQPTTLRDQVALMQSFSADVMVVVAYGMLLPQAILDIPRLGCINIHASILPRWRGAAPIQRAIAAGDTETGVSIMQMETGLDTGPVYQVLSTPINGQDTTASLQDKLAVLGAKGILDTLAELATNPAWLAKPQNNDDANYAKKITKAEAQIDWSLSAAEIQQRVRAFIPWPICQTHHQRGLPNAASATRIRIWQASVDNACDQSVNSSNLGCITAVDEQAVTVTCGVGQLRLETLQRDGGKPLSCREFCNGYQLQVGDRFSPL